MAFEKRGKHPTEYRPDVPPLHTLTEPLMINRRASPKVAAMIHTLLRHHDRLAGSDVTIVVLCVRDTEVQLKMTSDLLS
jgi:hypothetical protein